VLRLRKKAAAAAEKESLFSSRESVWDNIFKDIKSMPPLVSRSERRQAIRSGRRRQAMTAQEASAFDDMFNMIFSAVSAQSPDGSEAGAGSGAGLRGAAGGPGVSDLYSNLRRYGGRKMRWTTEADAALDRMREQMELCDTDQQLLEWSMKVVFGASRDAEEAARRAVESAAASPVSASSQSLAKIPPLQPVWYTHIVAALIRTFRDKYRDPHLALAMFDHAAKLSVPSYVFGCTTPAYNELLETKWRGFRDVRGVVDSLEEMRVNAVEPNAKTRAIVEAMRQDLVASSAVEGDDAAEVMKMLQRAERLSMEGPAWKRHRKEHAAKADSVGVQKGPSRRWSADREWKRSSARNRDQDDKYEFNNWSET
jgi:hypothetical protein